MRTKSSMDWSLTTILWSQEKGLEAVQESLVL